MLVTVIAALVAIPIGLMSAIFIAEYAPDGARRVLKPGLALLAGIPTAVYGYCALTFVTPTAHPIIPGLDIYDALRDRLVGGEMIRPSCPSRCEDPLA